MRLNDIFIFEEEQLNEIDMSPSSLQRLSSAINARAGMEFEMIVPNAKSDDEDEYYEPEPDYDYDESVRDIDDIVRFFDSEYNDRRQLRDLREELQTSFEDWRMEQLGERWDNEGYDFLKDYIEVNDVFDRDEALLTARDEIIDANPELHTDSEEFQDLLSNRINELEEQFVRDTWEEGIQGNSRVYDEAQEEFNNEVIDELDEETWLDQEGIHSMRDVEHQYNVTWPHWTEGSPDTGERGVDEVAHQFQKWIGRKVNYATGYHRGRREADAYVVEPDGSLEGDAPGDAGLEFVSPPLPLAELLADLQKVKDFAQDEGCYTNESTGLHINVSVPGLKGTAENLDYVKLALLLGDYHILDEFDRRGNTYCKSALDIVKKRVSQRPEDAQALLQQMRGHLNDLASKVIHSGITDKYTSINTKDGYIEFRSPGNDWLNDKFFTKINTTLMRFVVALDAAVDPQKYRQEYLKKLYAVLKPKDANDTVSYFAQFAAGQLPKQALKSFVRQAQLERKVQKDPTGGQKYWWNVSNPANSFASIEVVAASREEAIAKAVEPGNYPEWARVQNTLQAKPLRPYQEPEAKPAQTGNWGIWIRSANRFARAPGQIDNSVLRRFPGRDAALQWIETTRRERPDLRNDIEVREIEPTVQNTGSTTSGNWGVWVPSLDRYATIGNAGPRRFENRTEAEAWIQDYNQRHAGSDLELQVREIEPTATSQSQQGSGAYTYRVFTTDNNQTVGTFQSDGIQGSTNANIAFRNYLTSIGRDSAAGFNYEEIGRERQPQQSASANHTGAWTIFRMADGRVMGSIDPMTHAEAERELERRIANDGLDPDYFDIRPAQSSDGPPSTATVPGQQQQRFTGQWDVRLGGEVVFRVPGETQSQANAAANQWILGRSREFLNDHQGQEIEVVPRYE